MNTMTFRKTLTFTVPASFASEMRTERGMTDEIQIAGAYEEYARRYGIWNPDEVEMSRVDGRLFDGVRTIAQAKAFMRSRKRMHIKAIERIAQKGESPELSAYHQRLLTSYDDVCEILNRVEAMSK